jgi:hypothetical protein
MLSTITFSPHILTPECRGIAIAGLEKHETNPSNSNAE